MKRILSRLTGANPYRAGQGPLAMLRKVAMFAVASVELLWVAVFGKRGPYRHVDLMVVGAQKAGTTWIHAQLLAQGLAALPEIKESHHIDRGRMWTLRHYLRQFAEMPQDLPVIEVAPDYGPMSRWRIAALRRMFPQMKVVFIARNPADRAWSGARMETGFDRGRGASDVPVRDVLAYLRLPRARRYSDYRSQLENWLNVFGVDRVMVLPYEDISAALLTPIVSFAGGQGIAHDSAARIFAGDAAPMPAAVARALDRDYAPMGQEFALWADLIWPAQGWRAIAHNWAAPKAAQGRHLLYVCGFTPSARATSSGQKLAHAQVAALAAEYAQIDVVYFRNQLDALDIPQFDWPANVRIIDEIRLTRWHRIFGALRYPWLPSFVAARRFAGRLNARLTDPKYSDFYADFAQGLGGVPQDCLPMFTMRQHDIVSRLYDRQAAQAKGPRRWFYRLEARRARRWETIAWQNALAIRTLSEGDAKAVAQIAPMADVMCTPVRGTLDNIGPRRAVAGRIVFWGNMARHENIDAVQLLASAILPRVRLVYPDVHLWIVGAHPTPEVRALANAHVTVTGFVDDPAAILATAAVAAVPLRLGSGVKIKVFETLDAGIPTIVTPVGGEGIPDHPLLTRVADPSAMVNALITTLGQSVPEGNSRTRLAENGKAGDQPAATGCAA